MQKDAAAFDDGNRQIHAWKNALSWTALVGACIIVAVLMVLWIGALGWIAVKLAMMVF